LGTFPLSKEKGPLRPPPQEPAVNWPATKRLNEDFNPEVDGCESFVMNDGSVCAWEPGRFRYTARLAER
jgi:hypothetical protein